MTPQELCERALSLSRTSGCVVIAHEHGSANLRWAGNTLTTNGVTGARSLTVVAVDGDRAGAVTRSNVAAVDVEDLVRAAERAAADSEPAEDAAPLVEPDADDPTWAEPPGETSIRVLGATATALGEAFADAAASGHALYGYAEHALTTTYLASSTGVRRRHAQPDGRFELTGRTPDGSRSSWTGQASADFADVDVAAHAAELTRRLGWAARRVDVGAGRYETLLPPSAVADLMVDLYWEAGALDAHDGRTVFSRAGGGTRVGERLTPLPLTLSSDPAMPGLPCAPFVAASASSSVSSVFDNGLPLGRTDWLRDGELAALVQTRHSARVTALPVTPWVDNLRLEAAGATASLDDMVARTERGLLLTCLWYIRQVDPQTMLVTGLTRDGAYLVEGGEVVGAVTNFRFNESPVNLLRRATEVGAARPAMPREFADYFTATVMPPLRIPDFNMSSVSQAS